MGLRVEQRRELKELMKVISKSLDEVASLNRLVLSVE